MPCIHPWVSRLIYTTTFLLIGYIGWASMNDPTTFWAPGHLSRYHTDIQKCTQCHHPFEGPTFQKCVSCHSLKKFVTHSSRKVSHFHKGIIEQQQSCMTCHTEHQGILGPITVGLTDNPHGEFIFRVTGKSTCSDCHAVDIQNGGTQFILLENTYVRHLIQEGEGAHRSGHFASCLNCHLGGQRNIEKEDHD